MADVKFDTFTATPSPAAGDQLVGYNAAGTQNIKVPVSAFATGAEGDLAATSVQTVAGTAPITSTGTTAKTIGLSGTKAQFNGALTDGDFAYDTDLNTKLTVLADSDPTKGILIIAFGDSIMVGTDQNPLNGVQQANPNIKYWASTNPTVGPAQDPTNTADCSWVSVDPAASLVADQPPVAAPYTPYYGLVRAARGFISFAVADRISKRFPNRPIYVIQGAVGGVTTKHWDPAASAPEGQGYDSLLSVLPVALAQLALQPTVNGFAPPTYANIALVTTGTNDVIGALYPNQNVPVTAQEHVDIMNRVVAQFNTNGWTDPANTLWFNYEVARTWVEYSDGQWLGQQMFNDQSDNYFNLVPSGKIPLWDSVHPTAQGAQDFGVLTADAALQGPAPKKLVSPKAYVERSAPSVIADFDFNRHVLQDVSYEVLKYTGDVVNLGNTLNTFPPAYQDITSDHIWSGINGASDGLEMPIGLKFGGIQTINATRMESFSTAALLRNESTNQTVGGTTQNILFSLLFSDNSKVVSDGGATVVGGQFGAVTQTVNANIDPYVSTINGGTVTGGFITNFRLGQQLGVTGANPGQGLITIDRRIGMQINDAVKNTPSGGTTPVLTRQVGLHLTDMAAGVNNTQFWLGGVNGTTVPSGNWALYQDNTLPIRLNGAMNTKIETISGATASVTCGDDDHTFYFTGTANCTFNLPTATAALTGRVYRVRNSALTAATGNPTFNSGSANIDNGTATLANSAAIASGTTVSVQCVGTAGWTVV